MMFMCENITMLLDEIENVILWSKIIAKVLIEIINNDDVIIIINNIIS